MAWHARVAAASVVFAVCCGYACGGNVVLDRAQVGAAGAGGGGGGPNMCPAGSGPPCTSDADCAAGETCDLLACACIGISSDTCTSDADCGEGEICDDGVCFVESGTSGAGGGSGAGGAGGQGGA